MSAVSTDDRDQGADRFANVEVATGEKLFEHDETSIIGRTEPEPEGKRSGARDKQKKKSG